MTIKIRPFRTGGFEVDIRFTYPDGTPFRRRFKAPVESKSAAKRWGEMREMQLLSLPSPAAIRAAEAERKEVPTVREFHPRFIEGYAKANRHKASGINSKEQIFRKHLLPAIGEKKLDAIKDEDVQAIKARLANRSRKTVNNVLTVLGKFLRIAIQWKIIATMPCAIELLKVNNIVPVFYEFAEYQRLVEAAAKIDTRTLVLVLLGGDAGLRRGEMQGLRWSDIDFRRKQLVVQQAVWRTTVDLPKSGRGRIIPMTDALTAALLKHRHLRGERLIYRDDGTTAREFHLRDWVEKAQKRAGLPRATGALHVLRHTFCSHLAMRGAPTKAIQELAGHENLTTTMRYMHLSPAARTGAIQLLNTRAEAIAAEALSFGDILETAPQKTRNG